MLELRSGALVAADAPADLLASVQTGQVLRLNGTLPLATTLKSGSLRRAGHITRMLVASIEVLRSPRTRKPRPTGAWAAGARGASTMPPATVQPVPCCSAKGCNNV